MQRARSLAAAVLCAALAGSCGSDPADGGGGGASGGGPTGGAAAGGGAVAGAGGEAGAPGGAGGAGGSAGEGGAAGDGGAAGEGGAGGAAGGGGEGAAGAAQGGGGSGGDAGGSASGGDAGVGGTAGADGGSDAAGGGAGGDAGEDAPPGCVADADCADGSYCNGAETCSGGACVPGTPPCDDGVPCTDDACDDGSDSCSATPNDANCPSGQLCSAFSGCYTPVGCTKNSDCADGNACTIDTCQSGTCSNSPSDALCQDLSFCNGAEVCTPSGCAAGTPPCTPDGVACTVDGCDEGADTCTNVPDHALCAAKEICDPAAGCTPVECTTDAHCDDGQACSIDSCDPATYTCQHVAEDKDGDGHGDAACGGLDCNDANPAVKPGAIEACNGVDDDCANGVDDGYKFQRHEPSAGTAVWTHASLTPAGVSLAYSAATQRYGLLWNPTSPGVFFQLLTSTGDSYLPPISPTECWAYGQQVIHDGTDFAFACVSFDALWRMTFVKLSDTGAILVKTSLMPPTGTAQVPTLTTRTGGYLVGYNNSGSVRALLVDSLGASNLAPSSVGSTTDYYQPAVARGGGDLHGLSWIDGTGTRWFRLLQAGSPAAAAVSLGNNKINSSDYTQNQHQNVAYSGSQWGVLWQNRASGAGQYQVHVARLDPSGTVLGTQAISSGIGNEQVYTSLVWTGSFYVALWGTSAGIFAARVSPSGSASAPVQVSLAGENPGSGAADAAPALAWTGSRLGVAWLQGGTRTVRFVRLEVCAPGP